MKKLLSPEEENNILRKKLLRWRISAIICFIGFIFISYAFYSLMPQEHDVKIDYGDLNEGQINHVNEILREVKEDYLIIQKEIKFTTKELPELTNSANKVTMGLSNFKGKMIVRYIDNDEILRETICHEILHSFMRWDKYSHAIINDLEEYYPCFKDKRRAVLNLY